MSKSSTNPSFSHYMERLILILKETNRPATASHYRTALLSFRRFLTAHGESDIPLRNITPDIMLTYEAYLHSNGIARNTSSAYMRTLRAAYNRAVEDNLIMQRYPFRRVYTGVEKTMKRAVSLKSIANIKSLNLRQFPKLDFSRDMFLLSFYFRGMSFVDMAFLKKSDLRDGILTYRRRKTGQRLEIKWTSDMQSVLDKYPPNTSDYLLPIIRHPGLNEYYAYRNALWKVNKALKTIGEMVQIPLKLTHYAARHSWASGAQAKGIALKVISKGMGHDSESTTRIYLANLDSSEVDNANELLINSIK